MVRLTSRERSCSRSQTDRSASRQPAVSGEANVHAALLVGGLGRGPSLTFSLLARQLHQMTRFVDEEEVAGIVKILSLEAFCPEFQLDFVVAHLTGVHHALTEVQRSLLRWPKGQRHGLWRWGHRAWFDHRSATCELPRIFGKRVNAEEGD